LVFCTQFRFQVHLKNACFEYSGQRSRDHDVRLPPIIPLRYSSRFIAFKHDLTGSWGWHWLALCSNSSCVSLLLWRHNASQATKGHAFPDSLHAKPSSHQELKANDVLFSLQKFAVHSCWYCSLQGVNNTKADCHPMELRSYRLSCELGS